MKDTSLKVENKVKELLLKKSTLERVEMGFSMRAFSMELISESIKQEVKDITSVELKRELFRRTFQTDYTPVNLNKILQKLS